MLSFLRKILTLSLGRGAFDKNTIFFFNPYNLSATSIACPYIEFLPSELAESQLRKDLVLNELPVVDGKIYLPEKPGLGIELDEDKLKQYLI